MALSRPRRIFGRERLSTVLRRPDTHSALTRATVDQINADGTVNLRMPDGLALNVEVGAWYAPATGDSVRVFRADQYSLFVLGATRSSNLTSVTVNSGIVVPYNVYAVPSTPPPDPTVTYGSSTFPALNTRSYRSIDGWSRADVYQGAYSSSYGYWRGCYFYGTAPLSLRGKTVTGGSIRISRGSPEGDGANVPQYIAPHAHATRPAGAPYFTASARVLGYLDWGEAAELPVSASWLQAMVNGSASVRGFGHLVNATGHYYSRANGLAADSLSGRLTIHWRS